MSFLAFRGSARRTGMAHQAAWLMLLMVLFGAAIVARLAWLQLLHGAEFKVMADENRIRLIPRHPIRGRLLDRHGRVMATNRLTYTLMVQPRLVPEAQWPALRDRLTKLLGLSADDLDARYRGGLKGEEFQIQLAGPLTAAQVLRFREQAGLLFGAEVVVNVLRHYPHGSLGAHVMGTTSSITEEEYQKLQPQGYRINDRIGRSGMERAYETTLRGEWGGQQLEVNAAGQVQCWATNPPARARI